MQPSPSPADPTDTRTLSLETRVASQARTLWEGYGRPVGRDLAIWLEAERQVLGVDDRVNQQAGGAVAEVALHDALTPHTPRASTPDGGNIAPAQPETGRKRGR
jgi:hypothetical protein